MTRADLRALPRHLLVCFAASLVVPCAAVGSAGHKLIRKASLTPEHQRQFSSDLAQFDIVEGTRVQVRNITALPLDLHGCENCCNDGNKVTPCLDVDACAEVAPSTGKYAFVLTQAGNINGDIKSFLPNINAMRKVAAFDRGNEIDILLMMTEDTEKQLSQAHREKLEENKVKVVKVDWAVPPDMLWTRKENWCGFQDFIRLHVLGLEGYDAVAYYDSDVQLQALSSAPTVV